MKKALFLLLSVWVLVGADAFAHNRQVHQLVADVIYHWRSPDRYIDGGVLREEAELFIPANLRKALAEFSQSQIIKALQDERLRRDWALTIADAENLLKIRAITVQTLAGRRPFHNVGDATHGFQNEVLGLPQHQIDQIVEQLQLPEEARGKPIRPSKNKFSFAFHKLKTLAFKSGNSPLLDNDFYAFTVAAVFFNLGWHETKTAVFENSTRGADPYPFMVAAGQDQVLDLLEGARFSRWDIEQVRKHLEPRLHVDPKFYDWLAQWRFRGQVRSVPVGTVIFPKTPVTQIISDPASAILVESVINPWMSFMTNAATTATRNMLAAGSMRVTEAGTRRLVTGHLSALTALMAGASGTSNVLMASLTGSPLYGTMSHASVAMFPSEMEAFETFAGMSKHPTLLLPDTYDLLDGIRTGLRAGGDQVASFRQDSNIVTEQGVALSTQETVVEIRKLFEAIGRGRWNGVVTNDLTEKTLLELAQSGLDIEVVSVGGAFAASSVGVAHGNFVYKLVELRDREGQSTKRYPIKIANGDKSTEPAEKDLYRLTDTTTGLFAGDIKVKAGGPRPQQEGFSVENLLRTTWDGTRRLSEPQSPALLAESLQKHLAKVPPALLDLRATRSGLGQHNYPVKLSAELESIRQRAIAEVTPKKNFRILLLAPPENPPLVAALGELFKNKTAPHGFDQIVFIPEVASLGETLQSLAASNPKAVITLAVDEDVFWSIGYRGKPWSSAKDILSNPSIVVVRGPRPVVPSHRADTEALLLKLGYRPKPNGFVKHGSKGSLARIEFFRPSSGISVEAEAKEKSLAEFYNQQAISGLVHRTNSLDTGEAKARALPGTGISVERMDELMREVLAARLMRPSMSTADDHAVEEGVDRVVGSGPFAESMSRLDPYKRLPHFHLGWCTGSCDDSLLQKELAEGYLTILIVDAALGVGQKATQQKLGELLANGLKVMTSREFLQLNEKWKNTRARWNEVLEDLREWEKTSKTLKRVQRQLARSAQDPKDADEDCVVLLL